MISPSMTYEDLITSVKAAFPPHKPDYVDLRDINGEQLYDAKRIAFPFRDIASGERIKIGVNGDEYMFSELPREVVLFLEDDSVL
jgi:hypothetical protein